MKILKTLNSFFKLFGIDIVRFFQTLRMLPSFFIVLCKFYLETKKELITNFPITKLYPCLNDSQNLEIGGDYFHQDLLVSQQIFANNPKKHVDIGSRIDGFVTHVASFREIEVFDIRKVQGEIKNVKFTKLDLMCELNPALVDYCDSVSCLHVIEHFGLGRYGDAININGHVLGLENIYKILKKCGKFYFSVPIGEQRIEFNAHRVFSLKYLF